MAETSLNSRLSLWLRHTNGASFSFYAITASFCTYSCMYAFRKPFAVATFQDLDFLGMDYKVWLITAQVLGYTLSKFLGIRVVAEMKQAERAKNILLLVGIAGISLLLFALVPPPWNIPFLFMNGLPLGMIWGLIFSYLEGRKLTEILGAGLSVSFIFSSGFVKSVGKFLLLHGVSEFWMPFLSGLVFILPLLLSVWMLDRVPPPSIQDEKLRTRRMPMNRKKRKRFFATFAPGLILLILVYALLTAFRDFRDNFAAEMWKSLGQGNSSAIFTQTEIPVTIGVLLILCSMVLIRNNKKALIANHLLVFTGILLLGISTWLFEAGMLSPFAWMSLSGFGLYLGYVPFNSIFFDRLIAAFQYVSNVGFLIYLADAFGYLGSVGVMFYKEFGYADMSWLQFFIASSYTLSFSGCFLMLLSLLYFRKKMQAWSAEAHLEEQRVRLGLS